MPVETALAATPSNLAEITHSPEPAPRPKRTAGDVIARIRPWHRQAIELYLRGHSIQDIGEIVGRNPWYIGQLLTSTRVRHILSKADEANDDRLKIIRGRALEVLNEALDSESTSARLKAAQLVLQSHDKRKESEDAGESAEDVIKQILAEARALGRSPSVNINIGAGSSPDPHRPSSTPDIPDISDTPDISDSSHIIEHEARGLTDGS